MKQRLAALLIAVVAFLSFPNTARADTIFVANLTNSQENPSAVPTLDGVATLRPASSGSATFTLNEAMTQLTFSITVFNIDFGRVPSLGTPVVNPPTANPFPQTAGILNAGHFRFHRHALQRQQSQRCYGHSLRKRGRRNGNRQVEPG